MEALGRRAAFVQCDVRRRSLTDAAVLEAVKKMGVGPDILVASAGGHRAPQGQGRGAGKVCAAAQFSGWCSRAVDQNVEPLLAAQLPQVYLPPSWSHPRCTAGPLPHPFAAGVIGRLERAENVSHDGWTEVFSVNVEGSYNAAHACYPHMVKAGR